MNSPAEPNVRAVSDVYTELGVEGQVRFLGTHLHPGFEEATVALATRAAHYGFPEGGGILDLADLNKEAMLCKGIGLRSERSIS